MLNIQAKPIFFLVGIFKLQSTGIGRTIMERSRARLIIPVPRKVAFLLPQCPFLMLGFQLKANGVHRAKIDKVAMRRLQITTPKMM